MPEELISLNNESRLDKNYFLALALSLLVLVGYSFYLQKYHAPAIPDKNAGSPAITEQASAVIQNAPAALTQAATIEAPSAPEILEFKNNLYQAELSSLGGTLKTLIFKGETRQSGLSSVPFYQGAANNPGLFGISLDGETADLTRTFFKPIPQTEKRDRFEFVHEKAGQYRLVKKYYFAEEPIIVLELETENLTDTAQTFPFSLYYALEAHDSGPHQVSSEAVVLAQKIQEKNIQKMVKKPFYVSGEIKWAGLVKKYFALLVKPETKAIQMESRTVGAEMHSKLVLEPVMIPAHGKARQQFFIYAGPQRYEVLASFQQGFEDLLSKGFFGTFKILLLKSLKFFYKYCHNFGWAILILTFLLKLLFSPLTHMSFESMKKMQALQPRIKSIQERYKKDPTKMNSEMMELYKKHRVNPMGGCLPMLLQIPIFIAFYQMLNDAIELKGAPFIGWIKDLAEPDRLFTLPFSVPFIGDAVNILPLFMVWSMVIQQKMSPPMGTYPDQAKMMSFMMPIVFGFLFYNMPAGLVLYWFLNNVLTIIHQGAVKKIKATPHSEEDE